jgi:predicted enzyme related to lactoylglutathione lyase
MGDIRPADLYTRRAALTLAAAAMPAWSEAQEAARPGGGPTGHPVVHFEIGCRDRARSERFFADLFGWHIQPSGAASAIDAAGPRGIGGHLTALGHEPQHYTIFYVQVDDVQASLDRATALGGKTLVPPIKIPTGTFAWFSDLDGNTIGLLKPDA